MMELAPSTTLHGFTVESNEELPEIDGRAIQATHEPSGARLLYLQNEDDNKAFAIGFRTPPADDTGVFHILEHSVLCGSERFPVKEPFVDLLKSSMQTFLNAMTFSDKTLYPVASTNEQDLFNLMDVYLDAIFHPQIYRKPTIFQQEGWHLELLGPNGEEAATGDTEPEGLIYNGVVYNEMKGALSDANSVLYDTVQARLFPDTCYAFESGGTPEAIPTLTYEGFLDEHRRHYRTDNSYLILYGNLDISRALGFLDSRYLSPVAKEQSQRDQQRAKAGLEALRPRGLSSQQPLVAPYLAKPMDTSPENACAAAGYVIGHADERLRIAAADILLDALFGSNEAPLKRALLNRGVGHDIQASVADSLAQPFAYIQVQMPAGGMGEQLDRIIAEEVRALLQQGLSKELIEAALCHAEFVLREHEMGMADGVIYAMQSLAGWLYDPSSATSYLRYEELFTTLREALKGSYYEDLLRELFCESHHKASVEVVPEPSAAPNAAEAALRTRMATLSAEERSAILESQKELRRLQELPDSPEALATVPRLHLTDIGKAPTEPGFELDGTAPLPCLRHSVETRGIAYAYRYFQMDCLDFEELPYVAVLALVLGKLDTAHHTAAQIDTLVQAKLGSLTFLPCIFGSKVSAMEANPRFAVGASALSENADALASLVREILCETRFTDTGRIEELLKQRKIGLEQAFINAGHSCATARVQSYCTAAGVLREQVGNVGFYRFLCELLDAFEENAAELPKRLEELSRRLFCDNRCLVSFAGSEDDYDRFWQAHPQTDWANEDPARLIIPAPQIRNEAFIVPSDVSYAALGWDRRLLDEPFEGGWLVAANALTYQYLWNEVRVKGGAYGVGFRAQRQGISYYSYRDPHLDATLQRFSESSRWLAGFTPAQKELEGLAISTVATLDAPIKPKALMLRQDTDYFSGFTREERLALRDEALNAEGQTLRAFAPTLQKVIDIDARCVFGNESILEESKLEWEKARLIS